MIDFDAILARARTVEAERTSTAYWQLAHEVEDALLHCEQMPAAAFSLFIEMLSDDRLAGTKGISHFLDVLESDFDKLSASQSQELLRVIKSNESKYRDDLTRHWIADLIARKYPEKESLAFFDSLASANTTNSRHICLVGCDILLRRDAVSEVTKNQVARLLAEIAKERS